MPRTQVQTPTTPTVTALDTLRAQKRELEAQIKAAKAAQTSQSKLEKVTAWQEAHKLDITTARVAARVTARIRAGQDREEAITAVMAQYREGVVELLARDADTDAKEAEFAATE